MAKHQNSDFAVPPPLNAHDLRLSILTRLEQYRELQASCSWSPEESTYQIDPDSPRGIKLGMVQNALLRDIQQLSSLTLKLQQKLQDKRWRKWIINSCLAALSHLIYLQLFNLPYFRSWSPFRQRNGLGQHRPQVILEVLSLLSWAGYPIAAYRIFSHENRVMMTGELKKGLEAVENEVQGGLPVQDTDCLEASSWAPIPWGI